MRKTIASLVIVGCLAGVPTLARATDTDPGEEILFSALAAASNLLYVPAKLVVAGLGLTAGTIAGTLNGGDTRAAYAFWVPAAGGRYFLTSSQMSGKEPVEFLGNDYADRPSTYCRVQHGSGMYDALYDRR
jgi:hypothetical protein